jgi:hypothetical protein
VTYASTYGIGFAGALTNLGDGGACPSPPTTTTSCLIDNVLASGQKSGYKFTYKATAGNATAPNNTYTVNGDPVAAGSSGQSAFFTNESGVIRKDPSGTSATATSPALQ